MIKMLFELLKLRNHQFQTAGQIRKMQNYKLRELLKYAFQNSAYYRNSFSDAGIEENDLDSIRLEDLPTINKDKLLSEFDHLVTVPDVTQAKMRAFDQEEKISNRTFQGKYHIVHSSGSTGLPGYFLYDEKAWNQMILGIIRGALWDMSILEIGKLLLAGPRIAYLAATDGRYGGVMAVGDGIQGLHAKQIQLDINMPTEEWISKIREFQPNVIIGYPSAIKILSDLVTERKVKIHPVRIISCGEPLERGLRSYLEDVFSVPVINFYGASESLAIGVEKSSEEGMILFDDMNIIESINGKMYLTCLYNFAQPLIRYELTDRIDMRSAEPNDKYPFSRVTGLVGRNEDILWFTDRTGHKEFLHPLAIEGLCVEDLKDYQFKQVGNAALSMYAEMKSDGNQERISREIIHQMTRILGEKRLNFVDFQIHFVEQILPNPKTGKKQLIITEKGEALAV